MAQSTVKIPENAKTLNVAWHSFMAYFRENRETLVNNFRELRRPKKTETDEEIEWRLRRTEIKENNWKSDLLGELRDGKFTAYGRDITSGFDAPIIILPGEIFEELNPEIAINWELSEILAFGRKIIGIHVAPAEAQSALTIKGVMGRPASKGIEDAIERLIVNDEEFVRDTREQQCDKVRLYIFGPDVDHINPPKGYRDGAIKTRLRERLLS